MKKEIVWLGHNCWHFKLGRTQFLLDPYLENPQAPCGPDRVFCDYLLVSHGHGDHVGDALSILKRTGATVIAMAEVVDWFRHRGVTRCEGMNIGGMVPVGVALDDSGPTKIAAVVMMTPALHSSTMPDGSPGGNSCGFLVAVRKDKNGFDVAPEKEVKPLREVFADCFTIYFACDTGYFAEMNLLGELGIDVAVLPIGSRYTMGPSASLTAIQALHPQLVIPSHYGTWPPIAQNPELWAEAVRRYTDAIPLILSPGVVTSLDRS